MVALTAVLGALALLGSSASLAEPAARWAPEIAQASRRFGIPEAWIRRVIHAESRGEALRRGQPIVSPAGAMGLMQLMPGTWYDMRLGLGLGADPYDPADNILAGTAYLRLMYDRFGYPGLFAAYNSGPARYAGYLAGRRPLPAETRAYVAEVMASAARPAKARPPGNGLFALALTPLKATPLQSPQSASAKLFVPLGGTPAR